jgi:hypothetical protein
VFLSRKAFELKATKIVRRFSESRWSRKLCKAMVVSIGIVLSLLHTLYRTMSTTYRYGTNTQHLEPTTSSPLNFCEPRILPMFKYVSNGCNAMLMY